MQIETPTRVTHSHTMSLQAPPATVFSLLCPVREREWVVGWNPRLVITSSGFAERDAVFITGVQGREAIWVITDHEPAAGRLTLVQVIPGLAVVRVNILVQSADGGRSTSHVSYTFTALSSDGESFVAARNADWYRGFMREWEDALNHYLDAVPR